MANKLALFKKYSHDWYPKLLELTGILASVVHQSNRKFKAKTWHADILLLILMSANLIDIHGHTTDRIAFNRCVLLRDDLTWQCPKVRFTMWRCNIRWWAVIGWWNFTNTITGCWNTILQTAWKLKLSAISGWFTGIFLHDHHALGWVPLWDCQNDISYRPNALPYVKQTASQHFRQQSKTNFKFISISHSAALRIWKLVPSATTVPCVQKKISHAFVPLSQNLTLI